MQSDQTADRFAYDIKYITWTKMADLLDFVAHWNAVCQLKGLTYILLSDLGIYQTDPQYCTHVRYLRKMVHYNYIIRCGKYYKLGKNQAKTASI